MFVIICTMMKYITYLLTYLLSYLHYPNQSSQIHKHEQTIETETYNDHQHNSRLSLLPCHDVAVTKIFYSTIPITCNQFINTLKYKRVIIALTTPPHTHTHLYVYLYVLPEKMVSKQ